MKKLIDYITEYMKDGQPRKLKHIVRAVHTLERSGAVSSNYIGVFQLLRNHPDMFRKTGYGMYQMINKDPTPQTLNSDQIREFIFDLLKMKSKQTPSQIWRSLQNHNINITYNKTQHLLQSDMFKKDEYARYSIENELY